MDIPSALVYSLCALSSNCPATCRIRRSVDEAERDFSGTDVASGQVSSWLGASSGRVVTLYDQGVSGLHAVAEIGALFAEHDERGVCLRFSGEPGQIYSVPIHGAFQVSELTVFHYSKFDPVRGSASILIGYRGNSSVGDSCGWCLGENSRDGRILAQISESATLSNKPNGWWRTPMIYASHLGPIIKHLVGNYAIDQHEGEAIIYLKEGQLYIGGDPVRCDQLFSGDLFDLIVMPGPAEDADILTAVAKLCHDRMRPFPFPEDVIHVGPMIVHPAVDGVDGTNHPAVIKEGDKYYLFWNSDITGDQRGIHVATSSNLRTWEQHGRILEPGPAGSFDSKLPFAPRLKKLGETWVMWFAAQRLPDGNSSIGVTGNEGDLTNAADWNRHGQIISCDFAGELITIDPVIYYDAAGYDPGNGDGTHPIWMLYGSGASNSCIYRLFLAYADHYAGPYHSANGGRPVSSVDGQGYPYLWPGDIWRDPLTGTFWKLQSYGVTVHAGYLNGNGRSGWTYADSLAGPWYWVPRHMEYLAPHRTNDKRAIEVSFFEENNELHLFSANDTDDVGYRDSVQHWKTAISAKTVKPS